jgi:hypothetical protein
MAKTQRQTRSDDRPSLEQQIAELQRKNDALEARLAKGPTDETWFTPGLMSVLFLALFGALWVRYVPSLRAHRAPVVEAGAPDEYNPPPR